MALFFHKNYTSLYEKVLMVQHERRNIMFDVSLGMKIGAGVLTVGATVLDHMKQQKQIQKEIGKEVAKQTKDYAQKHGAEHIKNFVKR